MIRRAPRGLAEHAPILFPALMLVVFFVIPFSLMIAVSVFRRVPGGFYEPDLVFANYERFLTTFFGGVMSFSLGLAALVAALSVGIAFPFTYRLVKLPRRAQIRWLVFLLSILSLSEVIIGFAWSTLLSRTAGITNLFVALGLMAEPQSLSPSFGALLAGLVYQAFPYTVLVLYPALARLDPYLEEAARTLGSSPLRAFFTVVVPGLRNTIVATTIMVFVFALGSYLLPQLLGRPQHWTLSVLITDQAIYQSNMPFAAAMAVFLVLVSLALVGLALLAGRREETA
ncbi:ABC transporter permease (plasmid) [Azospirillum argentinense]|uniref:ABC transporter permease n=1 Tax=Azospirillum argentinense TaxID=2970906 RepID=A0A060DUA1_9PROT|nr:ABC transporter permease [Azospirillum argentinense]AIB16347.1 ABC transporter permease [Azospirillum argentinense]EZQ02514.1 ABC transporter permease [Azospirillum argentinense]KAA1056995.1 ABC transporter, permease protein 1 (cluster 1, maltose/g3p/polyamine/iron) [Azospirillum argentinense]MBK3799971.1 ABC transporter permease subunit [Azospirillum argentinense]PNQ99102.1 ABC transporter permease [Azospirillum argentinense]